MMNSSLVLLKIPLTNIGTEKSANLRTRHAFKHFKYALMYTIKNIKLYR